MKRALQCRHDRRRRTESRLSRESTTRVKLCPQVVQFISSDDPCLNSRVNNRIAIDPKAHSAHYMLCRTLKSKRLVALLSARATVFSANSSPVKRHADSELYLNLPHMSTRCCHQHQPVSSTRVPDDCLGNGPTNGVSRQSTPTIHRSSALSLPIELAVRFPTLSPDMPSPTTSDSVGDSSPSSLDPAPLRSSSPMAASD